MSFAVFDSILFSLKLYLFEEINGAYVYFPSVFTPTVFSYCLSFVNCFKDSFIYLFMCTCLGMHAHECEWVYASVPVPGGQKRSSRVVICSCLPIPLRQGLSLNLESSQRGWEPANPSDLPVPTSFGARVTGMLAVPRSFYGYWDPNSGAHKCAVSDLNL